MLRYVLERSIDKQGHIRRTARMSNASRRVDEDSRGDEPENRPGEEAGSGRSGRRAALGVIVLAGSAALVAATFTPVLRITVSERVITALDRTGWDEHGAALLALSALALVLLPAALRGSVVAGLAIALSGAAAVLIAVTTDLPDIGDSGAIGARLRDGEVGAGIGAYAETLGGVLLLSAGGLLALANRRT